MRTGRRTCIALNSYKEAVQLLPASKSSLFHPALKTRLERRSSLSFLLIIMGWIRCTGRGPRRGRGKGGRLRMQMLSSCIYGSMSHCGSCINGTFTVTLLVEGLNTTLFYKIFSRKLIAPPPLPSLPLPLPLRHRHHHHHHHRYPVSQKCNSRRGIHINK